MAYRIAWRTSFLASSGWIWGLQVIPRYMLSSDWPGMILTFLLFRIVATRSGVRFKAMSTSPFSTWSFCVAGEVTSRISTLATLGAVPQ